MENMGCMLCYGVGKRFNDTSEQYEVCPDCGEIEVKKVLKVKDADCNLCYGTGKTLDVKSSKYVVCPNCNKVEELFNTSPLEAYKLISETLKIPEDYVGIPPVGQLEGNNGDGESYVNGYLSMLLSSFANRAPLRESIILSIRPHMDIDEIAYSYMQFAVERGLTVLPYITITELLNIQYLYSLSTEDYKDYLKGKNLRASNIDDLKAYDGVRLLKEFDKTYYDFIHDEVCFIKIPANPTTNAFYALADLIQVRASKNLPTYVMSYSYPHTYKTGGLNHIIDNTGKQKLRKLTNVSLLGSKTAPQSYSMNRGNQGTPLAPPIQQAPPQQAHDDVQYNRTNVPYKVRGVQANEM